MIFSHKMPKNSKNSDNWRKMERWRYILMDFAGRCWLGRRGPGKGIAVVSSGHLGDILHAVPMLKAIRAQNPQKQLFWLVGPWSEPLAR